MEKENAYFYEVYYGSTFLRNSADLGDYFDSEEEAEEEAQLFIEDTIDRWKEDGGWSDYDDYSDFTVEVDFIEGKEF